MDYIEGEYGHEFHGGRNSLAHVMASAGELERDGLLLGNIIASNIWLLDVAGCAIRKLI